MDNVIKVTMKINVKGIEIELTPEEVDILLNKLQDFSKNKIPYTYPVYPTYPTCPTYPVYPYVPDPVYPYTFCISKDTSTGIFQ